MHLKTLIGRNLAATVDQEVASAGISVGPSDEAPVGGADLDSLPDAVQRYLRHMGVVGRPRDWSFRAHFTGRFRMRPRLPWMPCEAWQYNTSPQVNRVFHMRIDFAGVIPMVGRDTYLAGRGRMHGKLLGLTVVHGEGAEFDVGELTTYLNDAILLAPSMLLTTAVSWSTVDDSTFDVNLTDGDRTVTGRVSLDERGAPTSFSSEDRYAALPKGLVRAPWSTPITELTLIDGRPRSMRGSAIWQLPDGPFEYGKLALSDGGVEYNVWPSTTAQPRSEPQSGHGNG